MRILTLSLAAAASALAVATPAAAQWYPPQGNAYGYYNNHGQVRALQARINQVQRQIYNFDRRNIITNREARRLNDQARDLERRLYRASRNGLNYSEMQNIHTRLARLEQRLYRDAHDGRRGYQQWGQGGFIDRDRDGRDDRYEDDRGTRRDLF